MSKRQVIMLLGIWIIILPFLGLPLFWDKILYVSIGILIVSIAYKISPIKKTGSSKDDLTVTKDLEMNKPMENMPFVDHRRGSDSVFTNTQ